MIPYIYVFLELLMLFVLYKAGLSLKRNYEILSPAGITSLIVYTLVLGLRFGRGIDYNVYWQTFDDINNGVVFEKSLTFYLLNKFLCYYELPFQILIIIFSFTFILGVLLFLKNYREIVPYALPLFVLFSQTYVENMVRWYFAYSFLLIGLYFIQKEKVNFKGFLTFVIIGCSFHYAFIPIPLIFYLVYRVKKTIFHPIFVIPVFFAIYYFFNAKIMSNFVDTIQSFTLITNSVYSGYTDNATYWLTGGFSGAERSGNIGVVMLLFLVLLVICGYKSVLKKGRNYQFAYNVFVIGLLLYPISLKIELVERYDQTFFFFRSIVFSCALFSFKHLDNRYNLLIRASLLTLLIWTNLYFIRSPFVHSNKCFMYIWDYKHETADGMIKVWQDHANKIFKK